MTPAVPRLVEYEPEPLSIPRAASDRGRIQSPKTCISPSSTKYTAAFETIGLPSLSIECEKRTFPFVSLNAWRPSASDPAYTTLLAIAGGK